MSDDGSQKRASDEGRRRFLAIGIGGLGAGLGAVIAVPGVAFLAYPVNHPTTSGSEGYVPAGRADAFKEGKPKRVDLFADRVDAWNRINRVKVGAAWVVRKGETLLAFTTVCPHLGCSVDFEESTGRFKCPCHRSQFTLEGSVEEGPSPRPLDALEVEVKDGLLAVQFRRFKQGVTVKEAV